MEFFFLKYIYFLKGYTLDQILPCPRLEYNVAGTIYVILETPTDMSDWVGTISPTLKFVVCIFNFTEFFCQYIFSSKKFFFNFQVKDCDPETGEPDSDEGYNDEYVLEDLEISMSDFVQRAMKVGILISRIFIFEKTLFSYLKYF